MAMMQARLAPGGERAHAIEFLHGGNPMHVAIAHYLTRHWARGFLRASGGTLLPGTATMLAFFSPQAAWSSHVWTPGGGYRSI